MLALSTPALATPVATSRVSLHAVASTVHVGAVVTLTGAVTPKAAGSPVAVERLVGKAWHVLARTKTTKTGSYTVNLRAPRAATSWTLRVTRPALHAARAGTSGVLHVYVVKAIYSVASKVTATTSAHPIVVSGTVKPKGTGSVAVQLLRGKTWTTVAHAKLSAVSTFSASLAKAAGAYKLRVVKPFARKVAGGIGKTLAVTVTPPVVAPPTVVPPPTITTTALKAAMVTRPYSQTLTATGGTAPYTWSATGLPVGLLVGAAGNITGTPRGPGSSTVTVTVTDGLAHMAVATLPLTVAVLSGTLQVWGAGANGQIGNNTTVNSTVPVMPVGMTLVTTVASATYTNYAVRADGSVWSWGENTSGQLGTGSAAGQSNVPIQITSLSGVVALAGGFQNGYALKSDGTVWAWGANGSGQLGNNDSTHTPSSVPVQVSGLSHVTAVSATDDNGVALESDGTVWVWGEGSTGELGNGASTADALVPAKVASLSGVSAISGGADSVRALVAGTVVAWGANAYGQLGNGSTLTSRVPFPVTGLTGIIAISSGYFDGYALHADGTVSAWGDNGNGQLGNGGAASTYEPVLVPGLTGIKQVEGRASDASAIRADGTVVSWGTGSSAALARARPPTATSRLPPRAWPTSSRSATAPSASTAPRSSPPSNRTQQRSTHS